MIRAAGAAPGRRARALPHALPAALLRAALRGATAALVALAFGAPAASAGSEEYETFSVARVEEDDEFLLDFDLMRFPLDWRDEWERGRPALRTSQGCLTSGQWVMDTELRLRAPLGERPYLGIELTERLGFYEDYRYFDFWFMFPGRYGTWGAMFRPFFDKSRQDFALRWQAGADTLPLLARVTFGLEDGFNNLWAFRQSRLGDASASYEVHPYEPALFARGLHEGWRWEAGGKWLTKGVRLRVEQADDPLAERQSLWGADAQAGVEFALLGGTAGLRGSGKQARSTEEAVPNPGGAPPGPADSLLLGLGDAAHFRRLWTVEGELRRAFGRLRVRATALYQERDESWSAPQPEGTFHAVDRLYTLDFSHPLGATFTGRAGGMFARHSLTRTGHPYEAYHPSRNESRIYLGLGARFGRVSLYGYEGIELDPESYDVWFVHDKGFLLLQTTF
ncbi:MAG: hypothetical protein MUF56_06200 [Solirubrobacteraceae bacterium]|nr:hypothetical protein [Solirubrobacteraceae bacterium]